MLTGFQNICHIRNQVFRMNTFLISSLQQFLLAFCVFLFCLSIFCFFLVSTVHINVHNSNFLCLIVSLYFLCPSPLQYVLCFSLYHPLALICASVSLAAIITSYFYLLLFHSIIPSFLFTGTSLPFPPLLSSFSLFNNPLDANCLLWLSFAIYPSSFLSFTYLYFWSPPICYPVINKDLCYCCKQQEEGRGDT